MANGGKMNKYLLMALLTFVCGNAMAEWVMVGNDDPYFNSYADPSTILRNGSRVKMWSLDIFKYPQHGAIDINDGIEYSAVKYRNEYDCKNEKSRVLRIENFVTVTSSYPIHTVISKKPSWYEISAGTKGMEMYIFACGKN